MKKKKDLNQTRKHIVGYIKETKNFLLANRGGDEINEETADDYKKQIEEAEIEKEKIEKEIKAIEEVEVTLAEMDNELMGKLKNVS